MTKTKAKTNTNTKSNSVRLTTRAHLLCAMQAEELDASMQEIASEAIYLFSSRARGNSQDQRLKHLQRKYLALAFFMLGAIAGACVMLFMLTQL